MSKEIEGKKVLAADITGNAISGKVILVYTDALASGAGNYIPVTYLKIEDDAGKIHTAYPRDVFETVK